MNQCVSITVAVWITAGRLPRLVLLLHAARHVVSHLLLLVVPDLSSVGVGRIPVLLPSGERLRHGKVWFAENLGVLRLERIPSLLLLRVNLVHLALVSLALILVKLLQLRVLLLDRLLDELSHKFLVILALLLSNGNLLVLFDV